MEQQEQLNTTVGNDPVAAGAAEFRAKVRAARKKQRSEDVAYAKQEYNKLRTAQPFTPVTEREYVADYLSENPLDDRDYTDHEAFKLNQPYESRIVACLENHLFRDAVQCYVFRHGGKSTVEKITALVEPYGKFTRQEILDLLHVVGMTVEDGKVFWFSGYVLADRPTNAPTLPMELREYRPQLITETDADPDEF